MKSGKIKPCPLCGNTEIATTPKMIFDSLYTKNGDATISIECYRCSLMLYEHRYHGRSYKTKLARLIEKWNSMPRMEDTDDGK